MEKMYLCRKRIISRMTQKTLFDEEGELVEVFEGYAGTAGNSAQRIFSDIDRKFCHSADTFVKAPEERAAASELDAGSVNVG